MSWADVVARAKALRPPGRFRRGRPKIGIEQVLEIRAVHIPRHPAAGAPAMARRFGVTTETINAIVRRSTFTWIPPLEELGHG